MGLWPGGLITLHGETQFGQGIQGKVGSILPANFDAILPLPGRDSGLTTLSELYLAQALNDRKADPPLIGDKEWRTLALARILVSSWIL